MMKKTWTTDDIQALIRTYQPACILAAAVDLDVFSAIGGKSMTAQSVCTKLDTDLRATTILLDALAAMGLLNKQDSLYSVPNDLTGLLTESSPANILPGLRHQANCLRRWVQLARVNQTGQPAEDIPSIHGPVADHESFIGAMHNFSQPVANNLIKKLQPHKFHRLLDIGGASGTWTIAFLHAAPEAKAILFDLPEVIPLARKRIAEAGLTDRVTFAAGDYYKDELPTGADCCWLSAITHQNSRQQNKALFVKIHAALKNNSMLIIRDIIMEDCRTRPETGALFAINMLVATEAGGTYTYNEYRDDLVEAAFTDVNLIYKDEFMNSLICAGKP